VLEPAFQPPIATIVLELGLICFKALKRLSAPKDKSIKTKFSARIDQNVFLKNCGEDIFHKKFDIK
jgi:hypothetical protein